MLCYERTNVSLSLKPAILQKNKTTCVYLFYFLYINMGGNTFNVGFFPTFYHHIILGGIRYHMMNSLYGAMITTWLYFVHQ